MIWVALKSPAKINNIYLSGVGFSICELALNEIGLITVASIANDSKLLICS